MAKEKKEVKSSKKYKGAKYIGEANMKSPMLGLLERDKVYNIPEAQAKASGLFKPVYE